jgi:NADPH:quinone reductase-like Zn-dependent oxidoreductase
MRAAYLTHQSGPEELTLGELPKPRPAQDEVLVQVNASAITPTEFAWSPTFQGRDGSPRPFPVVLGHEFSGVVAELGPGPSERSVGDEVFGMNDWFSSGAQADYCVAPVVAVTLKPARLDHAHAAAVPISALTAWQGLFDRCKLIRGEKVLIHGGAGGVGLFAIQLAHWCGAHVVATASGHNLQFIKDLGADEVIDYRTTPFETVVREVDVVFDTVGDETLERSWRLLKPNGRAVTIATQSEALRDKRAKEAFFIVEPNKKQLTEIARLLDAEVIRVALEAVFPLPMIREAYARARQGGMRGKIALQNDA